MEPASRPKLATVRKTQSSAGNIFKITYRALTKSILLNKERMMMQFLPDPTDAA